jgi:hypothetical protein
VQLQRHPSVLAAISCLHKGCQIARDAGAACIATAQPHHNSAQHMPYTKFCIARPSLAHQMGVCSQQKPHTAHPHLMPPLPSRPTHTCSFRNRLQWRARRVHGLLVAPSANKHPLQRGQHEPTMSQQTANLMWLGPTLRFDWTAHAGITPVFGSAQTFHSVACQPFQLRNPLVTSNGLPTNFPVSALHRPLSHCPIILRLC